MKEGIRSIRHILDAPVPVAAYRLSCVPEGDMESGLFLSVLFIELTCRCSRVHRFAIWMGQARNSPMTANGRPDTAFVEFAAAAGVSRHPSSMPVGLP